MTEYLQPEHFDREDDSEDAMFYETPRLVTHLDEAAIVALTNFFAASLMPGSDVLDLMSSCVSHLPDDMPFGGVTGLGMNGVELDENDQLTDFCVHDLNRHPRLPFEDQSFDACLISLSAQYLVQPVEVFRDIGRVLRPGGPCIVSYSNRLFPTKAVAIWMAMGDVDRARLVALYFTSAKCFDEPAFDDISPAPGESDPIYVVSALRKRD